MYTSESLILYGTERKIPKMYDVMLIDDDKYILDRLKKIINWDDCGVRLVCEAQDSDTARELFMLHRPNIVVTDIQIPIISGLDLAKELLETSPNVRFIVITGYTDFKYVQMSVKLGAVDLISKPISPNEINDSIKKAVDYFNKLKFDHISSQNINLLLDKNLALFQQNFLSYLLHQKRDYTVKQITEKLDSLKLDICGPNYIVALLSPIINDLSLSPTEADYILVAAKNTLNQELTNAGYKVYSYYDTGYQLNCIISWDFEDGEKQLEETISNVHLNMKFYWNINMYSGFSSATTDLTNLYQLHYEAHTAYNYQGILGIGPVVNYKNIVRFDKPIVLNKGKLIKTAIMHLRNNRLTEMNQLLQDEISAILDSNNNCVESSRKFLFEFFTSVINDCLSIGIDLNAISKYTYIYSQIFLAENMVTLLQYTFDFAEKISALLIDKRSKSKNMLITMAKDYIKDNLKNNSLNLEIVSDHVGLSSIYFCKLFHKEEGISFNNYLNQARICKAKKLLTETNLKVFEVAYETGYNNHKYFNYVFKRVTGLTPLEYRNTQ